MKAKRILSMLLAGLMVAGMSVSAFANETEPKPDDSTTPTQETPNEAPEGDYSVMPMIEDITPPVLNSISIDKTEVEAGEDFTLTIDASDDISGVGYAYAHFKNPENGRELYSIVDEFKVDGTAAIFNITLSVPTYEQSGTFILEYLSLRDKSGSDGMYTGNEVIYYSKDSGRTDVKYLPVEISLTVTNSTTSDTTAPTLNSVSIDTNKVLAPNTITMTVDAVDDISGIRWIRAVFVNRNNGREITGTISPKGTEAPYSTELVITEYEPNGVYELEYIEIVDNSGHNHLTGNEVYYYSRNSGKDNVKYLPNEISFAVENQNIEDNSSPVLKGVYIDRQEVKTPGTLTLTIDAVDDISGVDYVWASFINPENERVYYKGQHVNGDGPFTLSFDITEFEPSGLFDLEAISLNDKSSGRLNDGNKIWYYSKKYRPNAVNHIPNELCFFVHNTDEETGGDVVASTMTTNLADKVDKMEDGNTAYIYYGNDATLDEEVFDAVEGKDKKLVLSSAGIQWEFKGKDVIEDNICDINLATDIKKEHLSNSENKNEINGLLGEENAIVVHFEHSGVLPAEATIRVKMDAVFKEYVGQENLYIYYYDSVNDEFVYIDGPLTITADSFLEFAIDHCSDYVIMNGEYVKPEDKPEDNTDNKPTWTPSYDDDEDEDVVVLEDDKEKITVEEFANGTVKSNRKSASKGQKVTLTVTPDDGYVLKSLTVTNSKGKEVEVTEKNGKYYFEMPSTKVSIDAEFVKADVASAEKTNPETGAGDIVDVSVAFAVCSVMCGAVLVSKKR